MALSILNNIASIAAQNQLSVTQTNLNKTLGQLSSGSRINSGADDAAGLAIANGLQANITALTQSAQNANAGVGSLQVADGALAQVTTLLNRAITLATESANGSVSNSQRTALQAEYAQINTEINSIGSTTNYNGSAVFSNTANSTFLSDGVSPTTISVTTGTLTAASLGLTTGTISVATPATSSTAQLTFTGDPQNGDQAVVDGHTFTFVTAGTVTNNGDVAISAGNTNQTALNLAHAINDSGGVANTDYKVASADTHVSATVTGSTVTFTALTTGNNNTYTLTTPTDASGNLVVSGATFTGGAAAGSNSVNETNDLSSAADAQATLGLINSAIAGVAGLRGTLGQRQPAASGRKRYHQRSAKPDLSGRRHHRRQHPVRGRQLVAVHHSGQSGISALAQANTAQQSILKLLQ